LKLGGVYCELVNEDGILPGPVEIAITEEEAWLLRSKVRTGDMAIDGQTRIGVSLLSKLYKILIQFNDGLDEFISTDIEEKPMTDFNHQFLGWMKEEVDAGREPSENTDRSTIEGD